MIRKMKRKKLWKDREHYFKSIIKIGPFGPFFILIGDWHKIAFRIYNPVNHGFNSF